MKFYKLGFFLWVLYFSACGLQRPENQGTWEISFGSELDDEFSCLVEESGVGYFAVGFVTDESTNSFGTYMKLDVRGEILWRTNESPDRSSVVETAVLSSDGYYLAAGSYESEDLSSQAFIKKFDPDGKVIWTKEFGGSGEDNFVSLVALSNGGILAGGRTTSYGQNRFDCYDFWLVEIDSNGNTLSSNTYGGLNHDDLNKVIATSDGGYLLLGGTFNEGIADSQDVWVVKIDRDKEMLWQTRFGDVAWDNGVWVDEQSNGSFAVTGCIADSEEEVLDYFLLILNQNGEISNSVLFETDSIDIGLFVSETSDGKYFLLGRSWKNGEKLRGFVSDADGNISWEESIDISDDEFGFPVSITSATKAIDGGVVLFGYKKEGNDKDFWIKKFYGGVNW